MTAKYTTASWAIALVGVTSLLLMGCQAAQTSATAADASPKNPAVAAQTSRTETKSAPSDTPSALKVDGAPSPDLELAAWARAKSLGTPAAYLGFHRTYPNSARLKVLRADVDSSYSMTISMGSSGSGKASGGPVSIDVSGHPELSGGYDVETAAALGIGAKANADGNIVVDNRPIKNVELFIAQIGGKPRIVAAKP